MDHSFILPHFEVNKIKKILSEDVHWRITENAIPNNDTQSTTQKTKDWTTQPYKHGVNLGAHEGWADPAPLITISKIQQR